MINHLILSCFKNSLGSKSNCRKTSARIELAEKIIKQKTGIQQVRVRDIDGLARIEVESDKIYLLNDEITQK